MPVHIEELTSDVTAVSGNLPLTQAQIEQLVNAVVKRLAEKERGERYHRDATVIRRQASSRKPIER
jgi:hypothetical protein